MNRLTREAAFGPETDTFKQLVLNTLEHGEKPVRRPRFRTALTAAALTVGFAVLAFAGAVLTIEPVRAQVLKFLVERFPEYSRYVTVPGPEAPEHPVTAYSPSYIPEGFVLVDDNQSDSFFRVRSWQKSEEEFITLIQMNEDGAIALDTEDANVYNIELFGEMAEVIEKKGRIMIYFIKDQGAFTLTTHLSYEETLRIAQSVTTEE